MTPPRPTRRTAPAVALPLALTALLALLLPAVVPAAAATALTPSGATAARPGTAPAADGGNDGRLLLMLDASGSMRKKDPSGLTKIAAAQKALTGVVAALPDDATVGLRVYGATVDSNGEPTKAACADTQLAVPVGPLDRGAMTKAVGRFRAVGETPIAHSLERALDDLGPSGKRTVVLVSDGEESCVPDPCPVVRKLVGAGVDLRIDTVGFGVGSAARKQLSCIAAAGHGTYYDAKDAGALRDNLARLSVRAARSFTTTGTPVTGSLGTDEGGPALTAGQYVDTFETGEDPRHYVLQRTIPGSTLHVSVSARPGVDLEDGGYNEDSLEFRVEDAEGDECTSLPGRANRLGLSSLAYVVSDSLTVDGAETGGCGGEMRLGLTVERTEGGSEPVDAEMVVIEEPPVSDVESLPEPAPEPTPTPGRLGRPTPVVGGTGFSDATAITPGTYSETYVSGETIFYRFPLSWGQGARVTTSVARAGSVSTGSSYDVRLYDPSRGNVRSDGEALGLVGADHPPTTRGVVPVRYRNREEFDTRFAALAGQYYVAVSVPRTDADVTVPMEVTFRLEVSGTPGPPPGYAEPTPSASPTASAPTPSSTPVAAAPAGDRTTDEGSGPPLLAWLAGGVALVVALVAGTLVLARRRRGRG